MKIQKQFGGGGGVDGVESGVGGRVRVGVESGGGAR